MSGDSLQPSGREPLEPEIVGGPGYRRRWEFNYQSPDGGFRFIQYMGCFALLGLLVFLCILPWVWLRLFETALERLHLSQPMALLALVGILLGGLFNIPVYRLRRPGDQFVDMPMFLGPFGFGPRLRRVQQDTIIAINVGGCVVPLLLAMWQVQFLVREGGWPLTALGIVCVANIVACYWVARPLRGVGIAMPWFVSPLVCILLTWLLLGLDPAEAPLRAPVAFTAGVVGPLVGADLLRLKDLTGVSVGMLSIGGAGTFDGIVLSSILATLLV